MATNTSVFPNPDNSTTPPYTPLPKVHFVSLRTAHRLQYYISKVKVNLVLEEYGSLGISGKLPSLVP